ncbi:MULTISPECIES: restriction endonuclease subunit S [unclassified Pseudoalteromonas]|uniref:restriction endonuclease subunit S n=1 Tax=unclassified Pseudoalteromonas TaxID=194690 RepID=UPI0004A30C78|nr:MULTISPECIES: restriction endonuclease subunit S [unclassified Pseudoalteromonas]MDC9499219.1 restriction endonuclease subunit S [Pseudoalteromonas sp. Angola-20]MDC9518935.1 restriction endonuclease subunit S [Pseudoalteromonas sp. Angola-22]MDC9535320.1 restriction endonuclease subunit S [Pseudoalteromonas sp. Angola-9]TMP77623.1 restriction endonuclease subunit S [Pseudoalteromonas sp. S983]
MTESSWPKIKLSEVCDSIVDCVNKTAPVVEYETPYKMIRTTNVKKGVVNLAGCRFVEKSTFEKWTRRAVPKLGDVILTREAPLGDVGMITTPNEYIFLGQRLMQYRVNPEKLNAHYLLYALQDTDLQGQLKAAGSGSTVEHIRVGDAENLLISLPPITHQKRVGNLLRNYDNLVENNNRRIAILEDMAQSLYREWFVNFRYPNYEDNLDADGSPKLIDSPLGQIPDGWEVKSAAEVITINPKTKLVKEGEKPFVGMSGLSQGSMVIVDIIEKTGNSGAKFINGDTLFARITPCLQNGKTGYVQFLTPDKPVGFGSTEFIVLRESEYLSSEFIYLLSRSNNFREHAIQSMTGATGRQRVHNDCFASCYLPVPPKELMNEFTQVVKPMFKSIFNLSKRNENIKQQRDMLLPKLISGQIKLKD